jgi:DNA-binding MarR family transcriptional regulator
MAARPKARAHPQLGKAQYEKLAAFRYHLRQFTRFSELAAENAGLTPRQYQALLAIKGFPNRERITIGELAEQLHIAHHSAVGLVDRSVEQNLIAREQGVEDRRQVYIRLTQRGAEILEQLSGAHRTEIDRLGPRLGLLLKRLLRGENH